MRASAAIVCAMVLSCGRTGLRSGDPTGSATSGGGESMGHGGGGTGAAGAATGTGGEDGGAGGMSGGGGSAGTGGEGGAVCLPADVFVGYDGCYRPDPICCGDLYCIDVFGHCAVATEGLTEPYLCPVLPGAMGGALTDFRDCAALDTSQIDCPWGMSTILCCEP